MIVESDDFNRQLYPSLLYTFLWSEQIYSYFSNSRKSKSFALPAPFGFAFSTRVASSYFCQPAIHTFFFFQQLPQQSRPGCSTFGSIEGLDCLFSGFISLLCLRAFPSLPVSLTSWSKTPCEVQSFHPGIFFNSLSSLQCRDWNVDSH